MYKFLCENVDLAVTALLLAFMQPHSPEGISRWEGYFTMNLKDRNTQTYKAPVYPEILMFVRLQKDAN